jgi:hypothetical protein
MRNQGSRHSILSFRLQTADVDTPKKEPEYRKEKIGERTGHSWETKRAASGPLSIAGLQAALRPKSLYRGQVTTHFPKSLESGRERTQSLSPKEREKYLLWGCERLS